MALGALARVGLWCALLSVNLGSGRISRAAILMHGVSGFLRLDHGVHATPVSQASEAHKIKQDVAGLREGGSERGQVGLRVCSR